MAGMERRDLLLISTGDPAGLGPEICFKAFKEIGRVPGVRLVPVGDLETLSRAAELVGYPLPLSRMGSLRDPGGPESGREILHVDLEGPVQPGRVSARAGRHAYRILETCSGLCLAGGAGGLVTGPINKEALERAGHGGLGHTEILARLAGVPSVETVFCLGRLKVFFLTRHLSLAQALLEVTSEAVLASLERMQEAMISLGVEQPRLGVPGLNPHCGDGGLFGREEIDEIRPAVEAAQARGIDARGPVGADSIFHQGLRGEFDAILALYHDQGHIAAKTRDFFGAVTLTLGLPYLRTSVDHGTGFDIAWKGKGNPASLIRAIEIAADLLNRSLPASGRTNPSGT
jgi:4-phospho-D-threonate 3-dehydrogenase / 4-phospho-D-erythronate 3-dehydrogenase